MTIPSQRAGKLFVMVGPAGAGKNSLMKDMMARIPGLHQLPTATSRPMREGEAQGREHVFVSREEFERFIAEDALLEHQVVHGRLYGILRQTLEDALDNGELLIADIEMFGARIVRNAYPDNVCAIFVQPPSIGDLVERMEARGDSFIERTKRLLRVPMELAFADECDYVILNDDLRNTADELYEIVSAEIQGRRTVETSGKDFRFQFYARVIPCYHDEMLLPDDITTLDEAFSPREELPADAALRSIARTLGTVADRSALIGDGTDGDYFAPLRFDYADQNGFETLHYTYAYRVSDRVEVAGFTWQPALWHVPNGEPA